MLKEQYQGILIRIMLFFIKRKGEYKNIINYLTAYINFEIYHFVTDIYQNI